MRPGNWRFGGAGASHPRQVMASRALAARAPAIGDDLAATHRRHTGPEAVPPFADQLARLIGAFHDATPLNTRPPRGAQGRIPWRRVISARAGQVNAAPHPA